MALRAHVFTNFSDTFLLKQSANFNPVVDDVSFTFGFDVPEDIDVLLVLTRASYSIPTHLPKNRTIFFAGEPDVIHKYRRAFLNQFGLVLTTSNVSLDTVKIQANYCWPWYIGVDFDTYYSENFAPKNLVDFKAMDCPKKDDKISVVTSNKTHTEFQKKRVQFLEAIKEKIPEHIVLYGRGFNSVNDKEDALLPHKYHIALENGGGDFTWTEKLSDPLICYSLPFYHGCPNVEVDLPANAIDRIDLDDVDATINQMMTAVRTNLWSERLPAIKSARELVFTKFNIMRKFSELVKQAHAMPIGTETPNKKRLIRSERSFWPEPGCRGNTFETVVRSGLLAIDPKLELRASKLHKSIEARRIAKRKARQAKIETS